MRRLKNILRKLGSVVVAYSGGLDSTFLLKAAVDALGKKNVLAVTARSETYPASEYKEAKHFADKIGAKHHTIYTSELGIKRFKSNPVNRCYYCKKELFKKLDGIKNRYRMNYVVDGTNSDDLKDIRYGRKAALELGVKSPLLEAGIGKKEIRGFSKSLGLSTWSKPSFACLASRFPVNQAITRENLSKVEKAEEYIRGMGIGQVRVRMHKDMARIELEKGGLQKALKLGEKISSKLKSLGFTYVTLDLEGYRTGSMHEGER